MLPINVPCNWYALDPWSRGRIPVNVLSSWELLTMGAGGKAKWWGALSSDPWPCGKWLRDHFPWISSHDPLLGGNFVARTTVAKTDWCSLGKNSLCYFCTPNLLWYLLLDPGKLLEFPGGNWETVGRASDSYHQEGACNPTWICTKFMVSQNVHALHKYGPHRPVLWASSGHNIKRNSKAYDSLQQHLVGNRWGP